MHKESKQAKDTESMPKKAKGKKAAAKAAARANKAKERAQKEEALAKLDALVLKLRNELKDDKTDLFAEAPPAEDCPLCMHPFPHENKKQIYLDCCGKTICRGCLYRHRNSSTCAFCRLRKSKSDSEICAHLQKRMQYNDALAFHQAYGHSSLCEALCEDNGTTDLQNRGSDSLGLLHLCRAAELGNVSSIFELSVMFNMGHDLVERSEEKTMNLLVAAARRGNAIARYQLGHFHYQWGKELGNLPDNPFLEHYKEQREKFYFDAASHFSIAAVCGHKDSLDSLIEMQSKNIISEEELNRNVSAYQERVQEEWSEEREEADKYYERLENSHRMKG